MDLKTSWKKSCGKQIHKGDSIGIVVGICRFFLCARTGRLAMGAVLASTDERSALHKKRVAILGGRIATSSFSLGVET